MQITRVWIFIIITLDYVMAFEKVDGYRIASDAIAVVGKPYIYGGEKFDTGVDCSALVKLIYNNHGYTLPRTASMQVNQTGNCPNIKNLSEVKIGDSLYFQNAKGKIYHVAIVTDYDRDGNLIITHAKGKAYGVITEPISKKYKKEFLLAKRFYNCTSVLANVFTDEEISESIVYIAHKYHVPISTIFTLASVESNFSPLVITIETTPKTALFLKKLREEGIRVVTGGTTFHSKLAIVNIYSDNIKTAQFIAETLKRNDYNFDLGLMQIHSTNFTLEETATLFYPKNNLDKSMSVYKNCMQSFSSQKNKIECYNRGVRNLKTALRKKIDSYPYYGRYIKHFNKYFLKDIDE